MLLAHRFLTEKMMQMQKKKKLFTSESSRDLLKRTFFTEQQVSCWEDEWWRNKKNDLMLHLITRCCGVIHFAHFVKKNTGVFMAHNVVLN